MTTRMPTNYHDEFQPLPDWPAQRASSMTTKETHRIDWAALYAALSEPFEPSLIRYRAGATNRDKTRAQALPYVDPRDYEDRLNQLVPGHWEVTFEPWGDHRIICRLTIHGVTRSSTGEASDSPDGIAGTSAEAQAFKRACARFGLGRYLYSLPTTWAAYDARRDAVRRQVEDPAKVIGSKDTRRMSVGQRIGPERGSRLSAALQKSGVPEHLHLRLATQSANRHVEAIGDLTNEEARQLWIDVHRKSLPTRGSATAEASSVPSSTRS